MVRVIYPLINILTGKKSDYYTMTNYDVYKYNKIKYKRGNPVFFTDDLEGRNNCYQLIQYMPKTIEESDDYSKWKYEYNSHVRKATNNVDYVASYASYRMLTGK